MSLCYHGYSESPGPSDTCEVCITQRERDRYKAALESIMREGCHGTFEYNTAEKALNAEEEKG